ncbi:MAG: glycosyltransferase family 2 protein [Bacteroidia bacterium]|nr:glycosyltransferase family 2 protein [Bacteroidia bacterium]
MLISVVTTLYYSSLYIEEFYYRIKDTAQKITKDYEIIFVDDGSYDDSLEKAISICKVDNKVKVIELSRNFGHHKAVMTGISYTIGDYVFLIDIDMEEPPELLLDFWKVMKKVQDIDVVYGIQDRRKGSWFERFAGSIFYNLFNIFSETKIPKNHAFCRLAKRSYIDALLKYKEQEIFLPGIWHATGFHQQSITINKKSKGSSTYTFRKKITLSINALTSFSNRPLVLISSLGIFISFISVLYILYIIFRKIFFGLGFTGYSTIVGSVWLIGGIIVFSIGIVGIYLSKIYSETKKRPYTIVRKVYDGDKNEISQD